MNDFRFTSDYLHIIRKVHRLTLSEMAEALDVSTSYIYAIETKCEPLTENVRKKLIETFELTPKQLQRIERDYERYTFKGRSDG